MKKMSMTIKARTNVTLSLTLLFIFAFSAGIIWCVARSLAPKLVKALVLSPSFLIALNFSATEHTQEKYNRTPHQTRSSTWTRTVRRVFNERVPFLYDCRIEKDGNAGSDSQVSKHFLLPIHGICRMLRYFEALK